MIKNIIAILVFNAVFLFAATGPVSYYGTLSASGNKIIGSNFGDSKPVQIRGISLYWSCPSWEKDTDRFWSAASVDAMVDVFKVDIVRAAMAAEGNAGCGGDYQNNKSATLNRVKTVVDRAIERDVYVIIDWHSHIAHNQQQQVIDFFVTEMKSYHNVPNVIFEIYNEPINTQWTAIKSFSDAVISAIRIAGANNLILVGTRNYAQEVHECGNTPVNDGNTACVLHFYAGSHQLTSNTMAGQRFQTAAENTLNKGKPIFVSEYGTVNSNGNGAVSAANADNWHAFMDQHKISSCIWSFSSLSEGSAIYLESFTPPTTGSDAAWANEGNMSANGKYILGKLKAYAETAEWRNPPPPPTPPTPPSPIHKSKLTTSNALAKSIGNTIVLENLPKNAKIEVYNLNGKLIYNSPLSTINSQLINVHAKGIYFIRVNTETMSVVVK